MSGSLTHSPSQIMRQLLADLSLGTLASAGGSWPITAGQWPDELTGRENTIFVQGMEGQIQGRSMIDGFVFEKHGINVHVRDTRYGDGRTKANAITAGLDAVTLRSVTISSSVYTTTGFHRTGALLELGRDPSTSCHSFSINGFLTVRQSS